MKLNTVTLINILIATYFTGLHENMYKPTRYVILSVSLAEISMYM